MYYAGCPGKLESPWLNAEVLSEYINAWMQNKGAVTINRGIYQNDTFGKKPLQVMTEVHRLVRAK